MYFTTYTVVASSLSQREHKASTEEFRFSMVYGDHMVLQQTPYQANVWGYTSDCSDNVKINFNQNTIQAGMITGMYLHAYPCV